jgi:pyrroline-5-carboxylate reductase
VIQQRVPRNNTKGQAVNTTNITFIGAGNMAKAIISGLLAEGYSPAHLSASALSAASRQKIATEFSIEVSDDNASLATKADVIVLAVKPQMLKDVALQIAPAIGANTLVISVAAGIKLATLGAWLGDTTAIVRCMPNTPSQLRAGASGLIANKTVSAAQVATASAILGAVGIVQWVDTEAQMDAVTAISGSAPAYFFLMMEAMIDAGVKLGLERQCATELTLQTALGAAMLAKSSPLSAAQLRKQVTSPNGTTERAILSFQQDQLPAIIERAMNACSLRAQELSEILAK